MAVTYIPYQAKKVLNVYKHIDGGWFWNKYSAYCDDYGCDKLTKFWAMAPHGKKTLDKIRQGR